MGNVMSDDGERIAALEVKVAFLNLQMAELNKTTAELRDMLVAAKGVRYVLIALVTIVPTIATVVGWFGAMKFGGK